MTTIVDDDVICINQNEHLINNNSFNELNEIREQFNPCYKKLDSWNSCKYEEVYYNDKVSVSNYNMNNISNKIEEFSPNDNYHDNFKIFFSQNLDEDEGNISGEEECNFAPNKDFNEPNFNNDMNLSFNKNIIPIDDATFIVKEEFASLFGEIHKNIDTEKTLETNIETPKPEKPKQIRGKRGPYKKKKKSIIEAKTDDECFPFTTGQGLLSETAGDNKLKQYMNTIFRTNTYVIDSNGNKKKEKKKRKYKPDDIRKKIKVRFHKQIKNIINENLKKAGSTKLFSFLPQYFISNISKKFNNQYMNETYENLLSIDFTKGQKDYPNKECDKNQYEKNKETLEYLKQNPEISKNSGFDVVKKKKYREIFKAYFASAEFEKSIETLKEEEDENAEYIQEYFLLAKNYIEYFMNVDENMY